MVNLVDGTSVFVRDCVSFHHPNLGSFTKGLVVEFFLKVCMQYHSFSMLIIYILSGWLSDVFVSIDLLLDAAQFNSVVDGANVTLYDDVLIVFGTIIVPLSYVHGLTPPIVRWNSTENRFDSEVKWKLCICCCQYML